MRYAHLGIVTQFVQNQCVGFLPKAPIHHQNDDLQVIQPDGATWRCHRALNYDFPHMGWQNVGRLKKADKSQGLAAKMVLLMCWIYPYAGRAWLNEPWLWLGRAGGCVKSVEPCQGIANFIGFKPHGAEFSLQVSGFGAGFPGVVVFVNESEHFKHERNISQIKRLPGRIRTCPAFLALDHDQPLKKPAWQPCNLSLQFKRHQLGLQRGGIQASARL